jgi:hypothetical protein
MMAIQKKYEPFVILKRVEAKTGQNSTGFVVQKISQSGERQ